MTSEEKIIKNKLGLLRLAEELGNVSQACRIMGYSRDSFYRFRQLYAEHGMEGLREISRQKPNPKNRVAREVEEAVVKFATDYPAYGQKRVSNELKKRGIFVSPGGVRSVWLRHNLENFKKRLKALEAQLAANESMILTEAQLQALEKAREQREAEGEIETEHPGYLGSQDTYYVGTIKGIGRIYQQTFIDTYSKVAFAKLYTSKTALTAADLLNDRVVPWFEQQDVPLLRILTDRGTEYNGSLQHHEYQLYLAIEGIAHTRTKARSPQTNGIANAFIAPSRTNSISSLSAKSCILRWTSCRPTLMNGWCSTIANAATAASIARDARRSRPSAKQSIWPGAFQLSSQKG